MAQYDGSIRINTKIDTGDAKVTLAALQHTIVKTADEIASLQSRMDAMKDVKFPTKEFTDLESELKKATAEYEKLQAKMEEPGKPTEKYKALEKDLKKAQAELEKLAAQQQEAEEMGLPIQPKSIEILANASDRVDEIKAKMESLKEEGKAFIPKVDAKELDEAKKKVDELKQKMADLKASGGDTVLGINTDEYANLSRQLKNEQKALAKYTAQYMTAGVSTVISNAKSAYQKLANVAKSTFSKIVQYSNRSSKSASAISMSLKNILKYGLGIRSLYALVNKMRTAMKEGFSNMAKDLETFGTKMGSLQASTLTLKNSFAAAFRPLVETALPYIQMVVDAMANLLDMVGQFMAAITGQKTYTKAIKQTTAAIEDENKAQNKQLSGLDKLNNLSSGSGGDADSGASTQMFEENVPISDRFADIAQWFKDMWADADFSELGSVIGKKIKSALENIPWDSIKQTVTKAGKSFATLINGLVEVPELALNIGKTIGEAINTGITGINSFLDNTDWNSVGKFIGDALNSLVNSISWKDIGHFFASKFNALFKTVGEAARTFDWRNFGLEISNGLNKFITDFDWAGNGARLGDLVKGALDTIITLLENTNWQELGNNVATFIGSIDWTGIFERLSEGIGAAIGGLAAFLWGLIEDAWNSVVEWWNEVAFEDGQFTMKGLLNGILEGIKNIGSWINEHIFKPFIEGFKKVFGIHSPSTVMAEMGKYIMQGLLNGIKSLVNTVVGAIKDVWNGIKKTFDGFITFLSGVFTGNWRKAWDGIVKIFSGVGDSIKGIVNGILGVMESLANGVINGINFVIGALNKLHIDIPAPIAKLTGFESFGFNIPELSNVSIPRLATGAVIPANKEFLAVLGDQKHGTNIEAPLDTIKQANEEAILNVFSKLGISAGNNRNSGNETFVFQIDGETFFKIMRKHAQEYFACTGQSAFPI